MDNQEKKHPWDVTPKEAIEIQKAMRGKVTLSPLKEKIKLIAGADVSMNLYSKTVFAGFVVLSYPDLVVVDHAVVKDHTDFPYIPGLLSFREIPSLLKAWEKLKTKPDLIVVDGVGIAHPRRLGIASHLGVVLDMPTIGCAKSVLTGIFKAPKDKAGSVSYLYDPGTKKSSMKDKEIIGAALRTKDNVKPVFISPGNKITLEESIDIIRKTVRRHRLPEATRLAHETVNHYRRQHDLGGDKSTSEQLPIF
jgi:deoxyribonuclease V